MKKNEDLRVIKTKKALFDSLTTLLKKNSFEDIKVSDICSEALVNRSTFYDHYQDKYELLVSYINSQRNILESALNENEHIINTKEYYIKLIKILLSHIEKEKSIYHSILLHNQNSILMDIFIDVIVKDVEKRITKSTHNEVATKIITRFYVGAVVNVCMYWLKNNNQYSKDEIIKNISYLIPDNIERIC